MPKYRVTIQLPTGWTKVTVERRHYQEARNIFEALYPGCRTSGFDEIHDYQTTLGRSGLGEFGDSLSRLERSLP